PYRRREIGSIEKEIEDCRGLNIRAIDFEDDMLNLDLKSFRKVLELFQGTGIELSAMNGLYAGTLDKETLELMYDAGFRRLNFSLVDASHAVHHAQQRVFPAHFTDLLSYLESSPFVVEAHFILGLPGQRHDDIIETMIFLMERRLLAGPSVYYLAPTSPLFHDSIGGDWERYLKVMRSSALYPSNPLFPRETTATFVKLTRFINMVKGMVDRNPAMERLSDIAETECIPEREHDVYILKSLLSGKRFISYDVRRNEYVEEPQDRDLVSYFFRKIHGKTIRGFKTPNRLTVDI
ncbi:MAG TPA: hypothetical protein VMT62_11660, partial [Syntrophorhabdaceae bacterium]|nr:hypothetical protein [Syntrophorhabdaceae bacterium]